MDGEDSALPAARAGCSGIRGVRFGRESSEIAGDFSDPSRHQLKGRVTPGAHVVEAALRLAGVNYVAR
jgi:hypothetical protein